MTHWLIAASAWALVVAALDLRRRRVGNIWVASGAVLAIFGWLIAGGQWLRLADVVGGGLLGLLLMLPGWHYRFIGGADVKIMGAMGAISGIVGVIEVFLAASVLFGIACVVCWRAGRRLAYLPALAPAFVLWLWTGPWFGVLRA